MTSLPSPPNGKPRPETHESLSAPAALSLSRPHVLSLAGGDRDIAKPAVRTWGAATEVAETAALEIPRLAVSMAARWRCEAPTDGLASSAPAERPRHQHPKPPRRLTTRIRPPSDVVRMGDRLFYLLQPPLEDVLATAALDCPFEPFSHQLDGIAFLYPRQEAVLADEMGLGKTMQAAVALRLLAHQRVVRRVLLICPKPLVTNWRRELELWAPELPVTVLGGSAAQRNWMWQHARQGVLLANYELIVRDQEAVAAAETPFDAVVIDEAQRIKNRASATNKAVCSIPRRRSWAMTGTPIENTPDDLAGIFDFVSPGRVRPRMAIAGVRSAVRDHVLRRTKDQVLDDLPPRLIRDAQVTLTPEQRDAYRRAEEEGVIRLDAMGGGVTIQHVFELVLRLKQICNFEPISGASAKLERLEADLEECAASGRKAIVFSQWVGTIRRLTSQLERFGPLEYHGRIAPRKRDAVIERFRDDPSRHVLFMSYGAGSVGLNLQFAQYVFLFDRWWNPAVEDQAINRAHRIGAAGPVTVTRLLVADTIEQRIDRILAEKRGIFDAVFDDNAPLARLGMSRDEIFSLFPLKWERGRAS